jgi:hypothetical protein
MARCNWLLLLLGNQVELWESELHQVWWPAHDEQMYSADRLPRWDARAKAFTDPDIGTVLPTFDEACEDLIEPSSTP